LFCYFVSFPPCPFFFWHGAFLVQRSLVTGRMVSSLFPPCLASFLFFFRVTNCFHKLLAFSPRRGFGHIVKRSFDPQGITTFFFFHTNGFPPVVLCFVYGNHMLCTYATSLFGAPPPWLPFFSNPVCAVCVSFKSSSVCFSPSVKF